MSDNIINVQDGFISNEKFLRIIFGEELRGVYVTGFKEDPSRSVSAKEKALMWLGNSFDKFPKSKLEKNCNTYFCISNFRKGADKKYRRRSALVNRTHVIMIDDVGPKVPAENIKLEPSYKLETSPGNYQYGYILQEGGEDDTPAVNDLIQQLIKKGLNVAGDPGMAGANRYARLPVGSNTKAAYKTAENKAFRHRLTLWKPERRYTLEEIAKAYKLRIIRDKLTEIKKEIVTQGADEILDALWDEGLVKEENPNKPGCYEITCLWVNEHGTKTDDGAAYFTPGYVDKSMGEVYTDGGFKCHHGHCAERHLRDVVYELQQRGYPVRHPGLIRDFTSQEKEDWTLKLQRTKTGMINTKVVNNAVLILENDPLTKGVIKYNDLENRIIADPPLPWHKNDDQVLDDDKVFLKVHIEKTYQISFPTQIMHEAVSFVAKQNRFDPIRNYLVKLKWDGKERIDTWLIKYAGVKDTLYTREVSRKFLVGAVARALNPGTKFDYMLILEGDQGIGKTRFVANLVPNERWYADLSLDLSRKGKDAVALLQGKWIIELGELSSLSKSETRSFKQFISRYEDNERLSYRRDSEIFRRRNVFLGTTNDDQYLDDGTGNRRFWPLKTHVSGAIKPDAIKCMRNQLWAEAVVAYYDLEKCYLSSEAEQIAKEEQEVRRIEDPWEDPVRDYVVDKDRVHIEEIAANALDILAGSKALTRIESRRIGSILRILGFSPEEKVSRSDNGKVVRHFSRN